RRRAVREAAVSAPGDARDRRQGADRGHRGLYVDLLVGGLQRHPAAEDLPHLSASLRPPMLDGATTRVAPTDLPIVGAPLVGARISRRRLRASAAPGED